MLGSWIYRLLPNLQPVDHEITSPTSSRYNCIAWAAGSQSRFWWPTEPNYWPESAPREVTLEAFKTAFANQGYQLCSDGNLEPGFEKIVLYALSSNGILVPKHAARQLPNGHWTSKLGTLEDIRHPSPDDVAGQLYGNPVVYMKRAIEGISTQRNR